MTLMIVRLVLGLALSQGNSSYMVIGFVNVLLNPSASQLCIYLVGF